MRSDFAGLVPDMAAAGRAGKAQDHDTSDPALIAKIAGSCFVLRRPVSQSAVLLRFLRVCRHS